MCAPWNGYQGSLEELIGQNYTVVFWHEPETSLESITVTSDKDLSHQTDANKKATIITIPISLANTQVGVTIDLGYESSLN